MPRTFDFNYEAPDGEQKQLRVFYEIVDARSLSWDEHLSPDNVKLLEVLEIGNQNPNGLPIQPTEDMTEQILTECIIDFDDDTWSYDGD